MRATYLLAGAALGLLPVFGCPRPPVPAPVPPAASAPAPVPAGAWSFLTHEDVFHGSVFITEAGSEDAESVLLVHGASDNAARDWDQVIPALAERYHVVAFDLPGFGRSSRANLLYSPSEYARFIEWVARRYVRGRFVLVGHSLGGAIALRYAAAHPEELRLLVLVDAAGILNRVSLAKELYLMNHEEAGKPHGGPAEEFDEFLRFQLDRFSNEKRADELEGKLGDARVRQLLLGGDSHKIAAVALALDDFGAAVDAVRTPTLIIWGQDDKVAPLRTAKALAGRIPGARLVVLPNIGHVPMREDTGDFNRIVRDAISSRPSVSAPVSAPAPAAGEREVRYDHQQGVTITGRYSRIELNRCSDARIIDATAGQIVVTRSDVIMENTSIAGRSTGLIAKRSEIIGTNIRIRADRAIEADKSHLDLAGATLTGTASAVATSTNAIILFSVSHSDSPHYSGPLHGVWKITRRNPL